MEKKLTAMQRFKIKLLGRWRLLFGNCPDCNSDAPEMYDCKICDHYNAYNNRLKSEDRIYWWGRFITRIKHNRPFNKPNSDNQ